MGLKPRRFSPANLSMSTVVPDHLAVWVKSYYNEINVRAIISDNIVQYVSIHYAITSLMHTHKCTQTCAHMHTHTHIHKHICTRTRHFWFVWAFFFRLWCCTVYMVNNTVTLTRTTPTYVQNTCIYSIIMAKYRQTRLFCSSSS